MTLTSKDDGAMATLDGQRVGVAITQGDTVVIQTSEHRTRLIRFSGEQLLRRTQRKTQMGRQGRT